MGMLIFIIIMMFSGLKDSFDASIPIGFPQGAEKIKLGYFKRLPRWIAYGDMIKLNDGRVLIYRVKTFESYIFDPKDDTFTRTAITNSPRIFHNYYDGYNKHYKNHTKSGVTLKNGKVLIINPLLDKEMQEITYYSYYIEADTLADNLINTYKENKTKENEEKALIYIREQYPSLYNRYKNYKAYEEDAKHAHLYNPETGKMETIDICPVMDLVELYKLLLKDGRVLIISDHAAALYDPDTNKFTKLPDNHKVIGYRSYSVLNDGKIFMLDFKESSPYLYDITTDTLTKKENKVLPEGYIDLQFIQSENDTLCFLYSKTLNDENQLLCYNPHTDESSLTPLIYSNYCSVMQNLKDGSILLTGKCYNGRFRHQFKENRPEYHVEWIDPTTEKTKILTRKVHYAHALKYTQTILLDDGRVLFWNCDSEGYELFIPYTYKAQKKAERKQLKQEAKKEIK